MQIEYLLVTVYFSFPFTSTFLPIFIWLYKQQFRHSTGRGSQRDNAEQKSYRDYKLSFIMVTQR